MYDMPEHLVMPINAQGQGPAKPEETVAFVCWCGTKGCDKFLTEEWAAALEATARAVHERFDGVYLGLSPLDCDKVRDWLNWHAEQHRDKEKDHEHH